MIKIIIFHVGLIATVALIAQCQVTFESCNLSCGQGASVTSGGGTGTSTVGLRGYQGKRGPDGSKGKKGDPAERCECQNVENLTREIDVLKRALSPRSCEEVLPRYESDTGGVYTIYPFSGGKSGIEVYCDLVTDDGGWLVFQKRIDGSGNFTRGWDDYVEGFGKIDGEFWLGLENLHKLTKDGEYEMRIDMEDFENNTRYAYYGNFIVGEGTDYYLNVGDYSGTAGSGLVNARFSTIDRDQDTSGANCAQTYPGGWWFTSCHAGNLNALYLRGEHDSYANGVNWHNWLGLRYSLKRAEMKIRKKQDNYE